MINDKYMYDIDIPFFRMCYFLLMKLKSINSDILQKKEKSFCWVQEGELLFREPQAKKSEDFTRAMTLTR